MTQITNNFSLSELTVSQTAARLGINNQPGPTEYANLARLCREVLQPLRDYLKRPVVVSSGYRSSKVNAAVGGSRTSAHMVGLAADIHVPGMTVREVMHTIKGLQLPFDQMIDEYGSWVHVGLSSVRNRGVVLNARRVRGKTVYTPLNL